MKRKLIVATAIAAFFSTVASAQMGPGMMGGYGPGYGMGPGMMGGYGPGSAIMGGCGYGGGVTNLSNEQRGKIAKIEDEFGRKQWALMQSMHELGWGRGASRDGPWDENGARKAFDEMTKLRKQMFENALDERKQIDAVLTKEQREQFRRGW